MVLSNPYPLRLAEISREIFKLDEDPTSIIVFLIYSWDLENYRRLSFHLQKLKKPQLTFFLIGLLGLFTLATLPAPSSRPPPSLVP